jgi:hypothetical protein
MKIKGLISEGKGKKANVKSVFAFYILLFAFCLLPLTAWGQDQGEDFLSAARRGDLAAVKTFLDKGVDVNTKTRYGATALAYACDKGHTEVVRLLIERGADVNVRDTFYNATPITWAAMKGHIEITRMLLDKGARGIDQVLMMGVQGGNAGLVKVALEKGGAIPETLTQALSQATAAGNKEIIELLKAAGARPPDPPKFQVDADTLKSYAGVYKNEEVGLLTFTFTDSKLTGRVEGQGSFNVAASDKTTFNIVEVTATIKFKVEGDKVTGFSLIQGGMTFEFKRVEKD